MRVLLPSVGTRGDVQPYLSLAQRLAVAGHEPQVASHPCMSRLAADVGVPFAPIGPDVDMEAVAAGIRRTSRVWLLGMVRTMRFALDVIRRSHDDLDALVAGTDLVVASHSAAGALEADLAGKPWASVAIFPQAIPVRERDQGPVRRAVGAVGGAVMGAVMTRPYDKLRRRFGAPPLGPDGVSSPRLNLLPISPAVVERDPRWASQHHLTGYWVPEPTPWEPDDALAAFLDGGDPVVAITFGAMSGSPAAATLLDGARRLGVKVVVQGWRGPLPSGSGDRVLPIGPVPYARLYPRLAGVVHHGGLGTTGAGFAAGVPAFVVPHVLDQFYWGQRVHELGCGPAPVAVTKLTGRAASDALTALVGTPGHRARAREVADAMASDDGVGRAVELIEAEFGR